MNEKKSLIVCFILVVFFVFGCNFDNLFCVDSFKDGNELLANTTAEKILKQDENIVPLSASPKEDSLEPMEVFFFDMGQSDSTLIKCGGKTMLIDCGDTTKGTRVRLQLKRQGVNHLDYLLLTHSDADHIGGAASVITNVDIDTIWMCKYEKTNDVYSNLINAINYRSYKWSTPTPGEQYELGDAVVNVIAPNNIYDNPNDSSIGVIVEHGENRFLFAGDAAHNAETDMMNNGMDLSANVFKVSHHGSASSNSKEFIDKINPKYAVISCGIDNEYGHPKKEVLDVLKAKKVKVFRTDEQGTISVVSDGEELFWDQTPSTTWKAGTGTAHTASEEALNNKDGSFVVYEPENAQEMSRSFPAEIQPTESPNENTSITYVLNTNTKKFHKPTCSSVGDIKAKNRKDSTQSKDEIIAMGYDPCKRCKP